jgi:carboxymethylenebutenolidase
VEPVTVTWSDHAGSTPALVYEPARATPGPAVVLAPEAFGINDFTRHVASELAGEGYAVVVPDYYRGDGLADPESYGDFSEVMARIDDLDFTLGTRDITAGIDYARGLASVDAERVVVWGYCTGATLAMLAASLDRRLCGAVLFFPSQPTFPDLTLKRPLQPIDLLWSIACPLLLIHGDQDEILVGVMPEIRRRLEHWQIQHEIRVYPGAGHAFSAPVPPLRNEAADIASWSDALAFAARHSGT